jgi:hypothetical protein
LVLFHSDVRRYMNSWVARNIQHRLLFAWQQRSARNIRHLQNIRSAPYSTYAQRDWWCSCVSQSVFSLRITTVTIASAKIFVDIKVFSIFPHGVCRGADKSLARPTSFCILFDSESISFDASLVYINSNNIPPIMVINRIYEHQNLLSL